MHEDDFFDKVGSQKRDPYVLYYHLPHNDSSWKWECKAMKKSQLPPGAIFICRRKLEVWGDRHYYHTNKKTRK